MSEFNLEEIKSELLAQSVSLPDLQAQLAAKDAEIARLRGALERISDWRLDPHKYGIEWTLQGIAKTALESTPAPVSGVLLLAAASYQDIQDYDSDKVPMMDWCPSARQRKAAEALTPEERALLEGVQNVR